MASTTRHRHPDEGRGPLPRRGPITPLPRPLRGHPDPGPTELMNSVGGFLAKGNLVRNSKRIHFITKSLFHYITNKKRGDAPFFIAFQH